MGERMVQVPVALTFREQVQALRDEMFENLESPDHMVSLDLVVERLDALLSQPTPSAESCGWCDATATGTAEWQGGGRHPSCGACGHNYIDSSTIRDVTPPKEQP